jgi:hypothetical protein
VGDPDHGGFPGGAGPVGGGVGLTLTAGHDMIVSAEVAGRFFIQSKLPLLSEMTWPQQPGSLSGGSLFKLRQV